MRTLIDVDPQVDQSGYLFGSSPWRAKWVSHPAWNHRTAVIAFRRRFTVDVAGTYRVHVSADQRYDLALDGVRLGRGPERSDLQHWMYETYDLELGAGEHVLVAKTWWLEDDAPLAVAQMTRRHGFLLMAEGRDELLSTGVAAWECREVGGYAFVPPQTRTGYQVTGGKTRLDGAEAVWGLASDESDAWVRSAVVDKATLGVARAAGNDWWVLRPAMLPGMREAERRVGVARHAEAVETADTKTLAVDAANHSAADAAAWDAVLRGERGASVTVPARAQRRVVIDLGNYYCGFPRLTTSGGAGAFVRLLFAEALYARPEASPKGNRDEVEGKYFLGIGPEYVAGGGAEQRTFEPLWWEAGRYVEVYVRTGDESLTIHGLSVLETHYPYDFTATFEASDERLQGVTPIALRTLEMCTHETYMDCPFYEQLMYVGDTRLEALVTYATTIDDKPQRKALAAFDWSRHGDGLTASRYPSRVTQTIPPFSLWWVAMTHDYMMWRDDAAFVRERMAGVRAVLDCFHGHVNGDGLVETPSGWAFYDWVRGWGPGVPPGAHKGVSALVNFHTAWMLRLGAELEDFAEEPELAARHRRVAAELGAAADAAFWSEARGLYANEVGGDTFSEHAQCLALLSDSVPAAREPGVTDHLFTEEGLARATIYFSHYLFEVCRRAERMGPLFERLGVWFDLDPNGFKTTFEMPLPTRSDCHAWGAHPVFHYFATVLGIRPASPGFGRVRIEPQLGALDWAKGTMPTPRGAVSVDVRREGEALSGEVVLPAGLGGELVVNGEVVRLDAGLCRFGG